MNGRCFSKGRWCSATGRNLQFGCTVLRRQSTAEKETTSLATAGRAYFLDQEIKVFQSLKQKEKSGSPLIHSKERVAATHSIAVSRVPCSLRWSSLLLWMRQWLLLIAVSIAYVSIHSQLCLMFGDNVQHIGSYRRRMLDILLHRHIYTIVSTRARWTVAFQSNHHDEHVHEFDPYQAELMMCSWLVVLLPSFFWSIFSVSSSGIYGKTKQKAIGWFIHNHNRFDWIDLIFTKMTKRKRMK